MKYRYSYKIFVESEDKRFAVERTIRRADSKLSSSAEIRVILSGVVRRISSDIADEESEIKLAQEPPLQSQRESLNRPAPAPPAPREVEF